MTFQVTSTAAAPFADWFEGLARLRRMHPPLDYGGIRIARWRQLIEDADRFLDRWDREATALGWNTIDLFGCSRIKPFARVDLSGLIPLLDGRQVVEMTETAAMIAERGKRHQRFVRRAASREQVPLWQLGPLTSPGP